MKRLDEKVWLLWLLVVYVAMRSLHFAESLNFSADQALASLKALDLFHGPHVTLIGPPLSINFQGHSVFFGPATYYFQLFFLVLGHFEPIASSYLFMLFSGVMLIPLFYGTKFLFQAKKTAFLITIIYTLLPFYIDYTKFLWNPNFQFAMLPVLILFWGIFEKQRADLRQKNRQQFFWFFLTSIYVGFLLQFHYQFFLILLGFTIYFFVWEKLGVRYFFLWIAGLSIGFFPVLLFELRHHFYNTQTLWLILSHSNGRGGASLSFLPHYFLSISFSGLLLLIAFFQKFLKQKISAEFVVGCFLILGTWSLSKYLPTPTHAFGMPANWNYVQEEKAYQLIRSATLKEQITSYNILTLSYDTLSPVQKYLLARDGHAFHFDDYTNNQFLFVIATPEQLRDTRAYELNDFQRNSPQEEWRINSTYFLYLLARK